MNFGITPITTASTNNINNNITRTAIAISATTTPVSESNRRGTTATTPIISEKQNSCNSFVSSNCNLPNNEIKSSKSFTTPQNCFKILTSIQNNTVPSDCKSAENFNSRASKTSTCTELLSSDEKIAPLDSFGGFQSMKLILPKEYNPSLCQNCLTVDSTTKSTLSVISNSGSGSLKNDNLVTEIDLNRSRESAVVETDQYIVNNIEFKGNINNQILHDSKISLNSTNTLDCDKDSLNKSSDSSENLLRHINSSDCVDKNKNVSRLSERAKKKSWYNVLYPNYKARSQDFRKLFKEVPNNERLIVDYSCALYRDLLIQGRLYISQNYVCFHANILGWETCLVIKWKDVTSITKEKTALVIPNAISICTPEEKFFFSSFGTRDKTFLILFRVWQNTLMNKPMPAQEIWQLVHNYYGEELGLTTDDEDYIDPTLQDRDDSTSNFEFVSAIDDSNLLGAYEVATDRSNINIYQAVANSSISISSNINTGNTSIDCMNTEAMKTNAKEITLISAKPEDGISSNFQTQQTSATSAGSTNASSSVVLKESRQTMSAFDTKRKVSKNNRAREESTNKSSETLPTDVSDSSDSEENSIPFIATAECNSPHEGRQLVHTILPINIEALFNMLFSKSKFLIDFHYMRKSTDLIFGEWITNENGQKTRTFNVTVQLAASVGPKTSKVTEFQVMRDCSKPGELYSIDINNVNSGIPYADSFSVLVHYCLVKTVDDHTMLSVHSQIKYKKSVWGVVKGFIEKNAWAGLDDFFTSLLHSLQSETCIPPAKGKGRRPRRGTAAQIRPQEEMPILQAKPEPTEFCGIPQTITTRHPINRSVVAPQASTKFRWLSLFVLVLLCFLIVANIMLLLKLWKLEERIEEDMSARARMPNLSALKKLPNNHEDWIELLQQQEILHESELKKWHKVLQTAIELLKKSERTLAELMFR